MATSLTRSLVDAHLAEGGGRGRGLASGAAVDLRVDQVLMDAAAASLVLRWLETTGRERVQVELALACAECPPPAPPFEAADALLYAQTAARRYGVHFSRAGNGRAHHVHAARHAAPGRTVLARAAASSAGALGSLVLEASEIELAAVLAGASHAITLPPIWAVRLVGTLPPGVDAHDLVRALAIRLPAQGARGAVLEYTGPGVAALRLDERLTVTRAGATLGASASLFPSDAVTRRWLLAQGREPDWKGLAGEPEGEAERVVECHLDALEPLIARDGEGPMAVHEAAEVPVGRVVLGADAGLGDLLRLAAALRGRTIAPGVEMIAIPGSRQIRDSAEAAGALADLVAAGGRLVDSEVRLAPAPPRGAALLCGASPRAAGRARASFRVSAITAAASALAGRIADPRELPLAAPDGDGDHGIELNDALLMRPAAAPASAQVLRGPGVGPLPALPPIVATLRGVVLLRLEDRMPADAALSGGPKVWRHQDDLAALAGHLYAGVDREFVARARAHGGGFLVAGIDYGIGPSVAHAALALVHLGVRAILARSFVPDHRAELIRHGVMALRFAGEKDAQGAQPGDELEIPGLPEVLEPNRPLAVRDLTRGTQFTVHHDLTRREIEMVRAGGLLGRLTVVDA